MSSVSGGKAGVSEAYLTGVRIIPPSPISTPMSARLDVTLTSPILKEPYELLQTFAEGHPDVVKGDILVINGKDYPVSFVEDWSFRNDIRLRIMLENPDIR